MTHEQRELEFSQWWENCGKPWADVRMAAGKPCWTDSMEDRRALWMRRYRRPEPPAGMRTITNLKDIQR